MNELKTYLAGKDLVKAARWYKNGDHPQDNSTLRTLGTETDGVPDQALTEGELVRYYRNPKVSERTVCSDCGYQMREHGWIDSEDGGIVVCPGDYVVTNANNDTFTTKPEAFEATYRIASE